MFGGPGVGGWLGDVGRWGLGVGECWSCGEFFVVQIGFCVSVCRFCLLDACELILKSCFMLSITNSNLQS